MNEQDRTAKAKELSDLINPLLIFTDGVNETIAASGKIAPILSYKDAMRKLLEEIREYNFAVVSKQGDPKEHTREHQIEESVDTLMALLTSLNVLGVTPEELNTQVKAVLDKFDARNWLA